MASFKALILGLILLAACLPGTAHADKAAMACTVSAPTITLGETITVSVTSNRLPVYVVFMVPGFESSHGPFSTSPISVTYQPPTAGEWRAHVITTHPGGKVPLQTNCYFTVTS